MDDTHLKIQEINKRYCNDSASVDLLWSWIRKCIKSSFVEGEKRTEIRYGYKKCYLEYNIKNLSFTVVSSDYNLDSEDGILYDVGINIRPLLELHFGTDDVNVLKESVELLDEDFDEISKTLTDEIDTWCSHVRTVFKYL